MSPARMRPPIPTPKSLRPDDDIAVANEPEVTPPGGPFDLDYLRTHFAYYARTCLKIQDKEGGPLVPLRLNYTQRVIVNTIAGLRKRGMPPRLIVLKSRQVGVCLSPETPVLTSDLRWVEIKSVVSGDTLLGVDEETGGKSGRKMRLSTVEAVRTIRREALLIRTDRGDVVATAEHRFLCRVRASVHHEWRESAKIRPGDKIRFLAAPWGDTSAEDGWFGGMLDGEGCLRGAGKRTSGGSELSICQLPGRVMDRAAAYVLVRGLHANLAKNGSGHGFGRVASKLTMTRTDEILRVVGQCRPTRFVDDPSWWAGLGMPGKRVGAPVARVLSVSHLPRREMIDLQTSTKTFIANGFVSHNSTIAEAIYFRDCHLNENRNALIVAHNARTSKAIFRMTKRFLENLPPELREKRKLENVNEIHFAHNDSRMQVEVAGEGSRGHTAQDVHASEFAFYANDHDTLRAMMQTVGRSVNTCVLLESTANGVGNAFHGVWLKAMKRLADSKAAKELAYATGFVPIFIPWYKHDEYRLKPWFMPDSMTQDEINLTNGFGLSLSQIAWRRWCIETNCDGNEETFNVEYPTTWRDAFLLSGRPIFDKRAMGYFQSLVPPEAPATVLPPKSEITWDTAQKRAVIEVNDRGRLWIKEPPVPRHTYIIGADPSEGDTGSTPTPLEVLDQMTLSQVAEWHGRVPPDVMAEIAAWLGYHYNTALIINEANNHGILFHSTLMRMDYPSIYFRTVDESSISGEVTQKPGFLETNKNKHAIFDTMRKFAREKYDLYRDRPTHRLFSPILIGEMGTSVYMKPAGQTQGATKIAPQPGHFIDTCIAFGLALFAHRGSMEAPLEPLPEEVVRSAAYEIALRRERDPEGAEQMAVDILGMTCEELERLSEQKWKDRMARESMGIDFSR